MAEENEAQTLKNIFSRPVDDPLLRKKLSFLCASYLGGVWRTIDGQQIQVIPAAGGSNNRIFVVKLPDETESEDNEVREAVLRIYSNLNKNHELSEGVISAMLGERRLGPALLGIFPGGRFEEFIPSRILTNDEFCKPCVAVEVGRILARVHSLDMPINKSHRLVHFLDDIIEWLRTTERWSKSYLMHTTLSKVDRKLCPKYISIDVLAEELKTCKECLARSGSPLVFSNNDLHEGNLLLRDGIKISDHGFLDLGDEKDPIVLIDYEYGCYYYRGFDLCHYCVECCQHNEGKVWPFYEIKQKQWPSEKIQREYVCAYLDEAIKIWQNRGGKKPRCIMDLPDEREEAIQRLLSEVRQFAAFPQLFWAIWSFQQGEIYQGGFDYFEYGFDRMALYYYWKSEMMKYINHTVLDSRLSASSIHAA